MTTMSAQDPARPVGLRERKKARTRASIREHALRLFREQGYHATTVEQIAEAAEISPSTFFRYFPTKEDVVIQDDFDLIALESFERQPAELSVVAAFRAAVAEARGRSPRRIWPGSRRLRHWRCPYPNCAPGWSTSSAARSTSSRRLRRGGSGAIPATLPCGTLPARSWV